MEVRVNQFNKTNRMISVFGSRYTQEDIDGVVNCLKNNWIGIGENVTKFENKFRSRIGSDNFIMVDSGSNGLYLAIKSLNLPKNSEIILPSFTWVSCAQSIILNGLKPVFCDVDLQTQNVNVDLIQEKITKKTAAIMVIHYAGLPVDIKPIIELGYPVIEDAAHAVNSTINGLFCGTFGDVGVWSFDSIKNVAVGEGGGIYFKSNESYENSRYSRYCGIGFSGFKAAQSDKNRRWWEYDIREANIKMLPTDIEGALGLSQLNQLPKNQERRKQIWDAYQKEFSGLRITLPTDCKNNETHSYFTYFVRVNNDLRDDLARYLYDSGIYTTLRYHPLHLNPIYKSKSKLRNSELLNKTGLNLPLHPNITDNDLDFIVSKVRKYLQ